MCVHGCVRSFLLVYVLWHGIFILCGVSVFCLSISVFSASKVSRVIAQVYVLDGSCSGFEVHCTGQWTFHVPKQRDNISARYLIRQ